MTKIGMTKDECIAALQLYLHQIDELMSLVEYPQKMMRAEMDVAHEKLVKLKASLERDCAARSTARGQSEMSQVEAAYFEPAVQGASAFLTIPSNSKPSDLWYDKLSYIRIDIDWALSNLVAN